MPRKQTKVLFVDDDASLLGVIQNLMGLYAGDAWDIATASDTAQALALLQERPIDLLVIDVHMPVVDGLQFLKLLQRKYPDVLKVVLTGDATGAYRAACLSNGAELFLEKPRVDGGWESVYATLNELAKFQPEQGFRGVLRRVGLQDVLQMECLARNSSVLEVSAGSLRGNIFVQDGQILHAQLGEHTGEEAFNRLLALSAGDFNLKPFTEPPARTIEGSWEFLIMEAARKRDEAGEAPAAAPPAAVLEAAAVLAEPVSTPPPIASASESPAPALHPQIDEMLVCSAQGDVLYEWQCANTNTRIGFLEFLSQKSRQLAQGLPLGDFDRLEAEGANGRVVTQIQADRAVFVRSSRVTAGSAGTPPRA